MVGVTSIRYGVAAGIQHRSDLKLDRVIWPNEVHSTSDQEVRLPLAEFGDDVSQKFRLLEWRGGTMHADHSDQLSADRGMLVIAKLTAGDYQLIDRTTGHVTSIVSVDGPAMDRVAVGEVRHRSLLPTLPLSIESIGRDENGLRIKLAGDTGAARAPLCFTLFRFDLPSGRAILAVARTFRPQRFAAPLWIRQ